MTGLFLLIWFYVYAGLLFGMVSNSVGYFPGVPLFNQIFGWPVYVLIHAWREVKMLFFSWMMKRAMKKLLD